MNKIHAAVIAVLLTITLAACSSGSSGKSATSSPAPATSTSTAPTVAVTTHPAAPVVWSIVTAGAMYLAYVKPANKLGDQYNKLGVHPSYKALTRVCRKLAASVDTLARRLLAGHWPAVAQTPISKYVDGLAKERSGYQTCATADTLSDAYTATYHIYDSSPLAERVRLTLGLPGTS